MLINPYTVQEIADKLLASWDDICNELEIPHLLIYGTALGFYRDKGYIKHDNDVDLRLVCNKEKWVSFRERFIAENHLRATHSSGCYFNLDLPEGILLFCIERSPIVGLMIHDTGEEYLVPALYHKFDTVEHNGRKYNVPSPIEEYLEIRYGKDWRIPNPGWNKRLGKPYKLTLDDTEYNKGEKIINING